MLNSKSLIGLFLVVGTAIGAGVLSLPQATYIGGFWGTVLSLIVVWLFMTIAAVNMLKARLIFKAEADLQTMTQQLLGKKMSVFTQISYLCLLIVLVAAYVIMGAAWIQNFLLSACNIVVDGVHVQWVFTVLTAALIYSGLGNLGVVNNLITLIMLFFLGAIITWCVPSVDGGELSGFHPTNNISTIPLILTTFGFSIIVPSLVPFMNNNYKSVLQILLIGSVVILLVYIFWVLATFGVVGSKELQDLAAASTNGTDILNSLSVKTGSSLMAVFGSGFVVTGVISSLLGVGQCLYSFLQDLLPMPASRLRSVFSITLGFLSPFLFIQFYQKGIGQILAFGGIFVAVILGIIPTLMMLSKKYAELCGDSISQKQRLLQWFVLLFFIGAIFVEVSNLL